MGDDDDHDDDQDEDEDEEGGRISLMVVDSRQGSGQLDSSCIPDRWQAETFIPADTRLVEAAFDTAAQTVTVL